MHSSIVVPPIFWTTVAAVAGLVLWSTIVGRQLCDCLPMHLRPTAKFYLAPCLGLAFLTVVASIAGRWVPLGNGLLVIVIALYSLGWAAYRDPARIQMLRHACVVVLFSLVGGATMLAPLLVHGGFNAQNDAFTYLAHSTWLQDHAFSETIDPAAATPLTTQISLYQQGGYRMGGSFLLALVQSLFDLRWAYSAYPPVIIAAISSCCLSLGFPLAHLLRKFDRPSRLLILSFPAFGFGGLIFGAAFGFLPQTLGLSFACGLIFLCGPILSWAPSFRGSLHGSLPGTSLLTALLFTALTFSYSELVPFVGLAMGIAAVLAMLSSRSWKAITVYGLTTLGFSLAIMNVEVLRTIEALKGQSGAVVGSPVDWTLAGFVAHALGVHGGAWDTFQWSLPLADTVSSAVGLSSTVVLLCVGILGVREIWASAKQPSNRPIAVLLFIFGVGFLYFRYGVVSPFPVGTGQSWSQFKLVGWANPFLAVFLLVALISLLIRYRLTSAKLLFGAGFCGLLGASTVAAERVHLLAKNHGDVRDLSEFYSRVSDAVLAACPDGTPVYLALSGSDQKFRQILTLYLPGRYIISDWTGDDYVEKWLPETERRRIPSSGNCVVQRHSTNQNSSYNLKVGNLTVGLLESDGRIGIASVEGAHGKEIQGNDWWQWVEQKVTLNLLPVASKQIKQRTRVSFGYQARSPQHFILTIESDGLINDLTVIFASIGSDIQIFDQVFDLSPMQIRRIRIASDGSPEPLSPSDTRLASWRFLNFRVEPHE